MSPPSGANYGFCYKDDVILQFVNFKPEPNELGNKLIKEIKDALKNNIYKDWIDKIEKIEIIYDEPYNSKLENNIGNGYKSYFDEDNKYLNYILNCKTFHTDYFENTCKYSLFSYIIDLKNNKFDVYTGDANYCRLFNSYDIFNLNYF